MRIKSLGTTQDVLELTDHWLVHTEKSGNSESKDANLRNISPSQKSVDNLISDHKTTHYLLYSKIIKNL